MWIVDIRKINKATYRFTCAKRPESNKKKSSKYWNEIYFPTFLPPQNIYSIKVPWLVILVGARRLLNYELIHTHLLSFIFQIEIARLCVKRTTFSRSVLILFHLFTFRIRMKRNEILEPQLANVQ